MDNIPIQVDAERLLGDQRMKVGVWFYGLGTLVSTLKGGS